MQTLKKYYFFILLLSLGLNAHAQDQWKLMGQHNGTDVRLIWTRSSYPAEVQGIVVKRRSVGGVWQQLTKKAIYLGVIASKDLSNVSTDAAHITAIKNKMAAKPDEFSIDSTKFRNVLSNQGGLESFMFALAKDYDLTLLTGLGYEEINISAVKGTKVEYGIFPVINGTAAAAPAAVWSCVMGQPTAFDLKTSSIVKAKKAKHQVKVTWSLNSQKIIASNIVYAFHIYRTIDGKRSRMTDLPALANVADPICKIPYVDTVTNMATKVVYELSPISIFGWELPGYIATYDPAQFPIEFTPVLVSQYKEGDKPMLFNIQIPASVIPFIDSIRLEEFSGASDYYKRKLYAGSAKEAIITFDTARVYPKKYTFRIVVFLRTDEEPVKSADVDLQYSPDMRYEAVSDITGEFISEGDNRFIRLKWKAVPNAAGYHLYTQDATTGNMIWEASIDLIKATQFDFPILISASKSYTFSIGAVNSKGFDESPLKNVATVVTPSKYLLRVWFAESVTQQDSLVKLTWTYQEPGDVKGYRIYENGSLITDEQVLTKGKTSWISTPRKPGRYVYKIEAITYYGVASPLSEERTVIIIKK